MRRIPIIARRLRAAKPLEVRTFAKADPAKPLADAALDLLTQVPQPSACLVFANTPRTARETFERLRRRMSDTEAETLLLTGLTREREAERMRACILDPNDGMAATRLGGSARPRHLVVVATQTLEVGADIDAEYLVTEACGVRALTERLGRFNRFGHHDQARAVYVHAPPPTRRGVEAGRGRTPETWPVYDEEPTRVLKQLRQAGGRGERCVVDLPPARVADVLGVPDDDAGRAPEVLPGILWEWTKTTTPPDGEAPVEPYFSGIRGAEYTVSLIWRVHLPREGDRLWPRAADREAVDVSLREALEALEGDDDLCRLAPDGVIVEATRAADLRPGDQFVLPSDRGLLDRFGWNPAATERVVDASLAGQGLPLDGEAITRLCGIDAAPHLRIVLADDEHEEFDQAERDNAARAILTQLSETATPTGWDTAEWTEFILTLDARVEAPRHEVPRLRVATPAPHRTAGDLGSDFDELSLGRRRSGWPSTAIRWHGGRERSRGALGCRPT